MNLYSQDIEMVFKDYFGEEHLWLDQVSKLDELIEGKLVEREQLWALATKVTSSSDGMPHGNEVSDKVGNIVVKLRTLAEETDALVDHYIDYKREVIRTLEKLPAREYAVLHRFYIEYMTINEIANAMGYSESQVKRIKKKGLKNIKMIRNELE